VAGVIKMVEAMRRGSVPRTLHAETASTKVDWDSGAVRAGRRSPRSASAARTRT
jgi:acyl transferase domain-containing protein